MPRVELTIADITLARVDAIVNAANPVMLGGGGVDGAIHRAAGPALREACEAVPSHNGVRCPTGEARITPAGALAARYVIHTVGPRYQLDPQPRSLLRAAYRNSFQLALDWHCTTLAVPAVSCGVYGYPAGEAGQIALGVALEERFRSLHITFCLFSQAMYEVWAAEYQSLQKA